MNFYILVTDTAKPRNYLPYIILRSLDFKFSFPPGRFDYQWPHGDNYFFLFFYFLTIEFLYFLICLPELRMPIYLAVVVSLFPLIIYDYCPYNIVPHNLPS